MEKKKDLDDLLKEFEDKSKDYVSKHRQLWEGTPEDELFNVDIHIWRTTGMGNSLQSIVGSKVSIMTALTSFFKTLRDKNVLSDKELQECVDISKKDFNE